MLINVNYDTSVKSAPSGFETTVNDVVSYYETVFANPVTVTVDVGYGEIDGQSIRKGILGESEAGFQQVTYSQLETALATNLVTIGNTSAAESLPATDPIKNASYEVTTAEAKALGLENNNSSMDGYLGIGIETGAFYFDGDGGIQKNQYDLFGVVAHEFSEIMGRALSASSGTAYQPLDLFHYSQLNVHDFSGHRVGYLSADGGQTVLNDFNINPKGDFGDWAASAGNDAFRAFYPQGAVEPVTKTDLTEMMLLGWDPSASSQPSSPSQPVAIQHGKYDTFVFSPDLGNETISNFNTPHDSIDIPKTLAETFVQVRADMEQVGDNTVITLSGDHVITVTDTHHMLHSYNFHFIV